MMRILKNWETEILRPIVVNVLSAGTLFLIALLFHKPIMSLFKSEPVLQYPLLCIFEPHKSKAEPHLSIDLFIVNKDGIDYTNEELNERLEVFKADEDVLLSADIDLRYKSVIGELISVQPVEEFNEGKGTIKITRIDNRHVRIRIAEIHQRAIMKVELAVTATPLQLPQEISRTARGQIPIDYQSLHQNCYTEG